MSTVSPVELLLSRNNDLLAVIAKAMLRTTIESMLTDKRQRHLYELTGKHIPVNELTKRVGLGAGTISRSWQQWEEAGLVIKEGKSYRRVFP